jgi:hypothetical protein
MSLSGYNPSGCEFYDAASQRQMKYVYPDSGHWTAGWILWKHPDGQWVTLRKATDADLTLINRAIVDAYHGCS